jgi:hypothetical protein
MLNRSAVVGRLTNNSEFRDFNYIPKMLVLCIVFHSTFTVCINHTPANN